MTENIKERNKRVAADKAWEMSLTRRVLIAIITYIIVGFYLNLINISYPWLHALVPPIAYMLSTLSLPIIKKFWICKIYNKKDI